MDRWAAPEATPEADDVIVDENETNFTSLSLDAEGNPEHVTPEDTDDWAPEDYAS